MNNQIKKTGILIIMLVVPVFLYLFLKIFGENEFVKLEVENPQIVGCEPNLLEGKHQVPPFRLTAHTGEEVSEQFVEGKVYVANFIFTNCPSTCPLLSSAMARVQERFREKDEVRLISHTVDPENDSVPVLASYADNYKADPEKWLFVTGDKSALYTQARCGYAVVAKPREENPNDFIHTDKLVLIDRNRQIRGYYDGTDRVDVDRLLSEIKLLLWEYGIKS